jgi:hypothetical protein
MDLHRHQPRGGTPVRKALYLILIAGAAFGQTPQPNDTVLAWKPQTPYMHGASGWPSMPHNLWTNSLLWLTRESPVLNEGATNANWICYAKTCAGNATQVDPNKQPTAVVTNGVKGFLFDGTDGFLSTGNYWVGNNFAVEVDMTPLGAPVAVTHYIVGSYSIGDTNRAWAVARFNNNIIFTTSMNGALPVVSSDAANVFSSGTRIKIRWEKTGTSARLFVNGVSNALGVAGSHGNVFSNNVPVFIGARSDNYTENPWSAAGYAKFILHDVKIWRLP